MLIYTKSSPYGQTTLVANKQTTIQWEESMKKKEQGKSPKNNQRIHKGFTRHFLF